MKNDNFKNNMKKFLDKPVESKECTGEECIIKTDKSLIEVKQLNKKIIVEDGRQLLT